MTIPPLSRASLDRDHASRMRPDALEAALGEQTTRIVLVRGDAAPIVDGRILRVEPAAVPAGAEVSWMGRTRDDGDVPRGSIVLAAAVAADAEPPAGAEWQSLRGVGHRLDDADAGVLVQAVALANWQAASRFSPIDGSEASFEESGWVRRDTAGAQHFPRTDPAVIVAIHDEADERILLGHNALWPEGRYSLFAGFVDPGESLEAAVVREVWEEAGVDVVDPTYVASQPWPFPRSLMLGFECVASNPEAARPDGVEILDVQWVTRDDLRAGRPALPGGASIASFLIQRWIDRG